MKKNIFFLFIFTFLLSACSSDDEDLIAVTSISLDTTQLTLLEGESATISATVSPDNATNSTVTWSSSDTSVATVDKTGHITAVERGTAIITATAGNITVICTVTVKIGEAEQTVLMFMPWSNNLLTYFKQNIEDMKDAIEEIAPTTERVLVCLAESTTKTSLFELTYENATCTADTLKTYSSPDFTNCGQITSMLNDVVSASPAKRYAMIIGCHGMGWLPSTKTKAGSANTKSEIKYHWDYTDGPITRYFGGTSSAYQIEISTLADAINDAGLHMEYILFDDCYMSSIEVAYDLKDVTDNLIACPTEIMAYGFPYHTTGQYLIGTVDYASISEAFYAFYSTYSDPYGTIGITNCSELDNLASIMKEINGQYTFDTKLLDDVQRMDGYTPVIFFDYGDYVAHLCEDESLLETFNEQLELTVPYKAHTTKYYAARKGAISISAYSGITTTDPSTNSLTSTKDETAWYNATH